MFVQILGVEIIPIPVRGAAGEDEPRVFGVFVLFFGFRNNELASKEERKQNNALPDRLPENVLDHLARHDVVLSVLRHS
jgi:hypothetical protein